MPIMGIFGGTSAQDLRTIKQKLKDLEDKFQTRKSQAIADRVAAIAELKNELDEITNL